MAEEVVSILGIFKDLISAPARGAVNVVKLMADGVRGLEHAVAPLTGKIAGLVAGFASFETVKKSIADFRALEETMQGLKGALGEQEGQFDRLKDSAEEFSKTTTNSAESIMKLQSTLLNRGVTLGQLDDAVKAAVDMSAALGMGLDSAGMQIAQTYQGIVPRSLRKANIEFKNLTQTQLESGAAAQLVQKIYGGRAVERAATESGQLTMQENRLKTVYEDMGKVLIRLQVQIMPPLIDAFKRLADRLTSPEGQKFLQLVTKIIVAFIQWSDKIAIILLGLKGLGLITAAFGSGATYAIAFAAAIVSAGVALGALVVSLLDLAPGLHSLEDFKKLIGDVFGRIQDGTLTWRGFFDQLTSDLILLGKKWKLYLYDIPKSYITNAGTAAKGFLNSINPAETGRYLADYQQIHQLVDEQGFTPDQALDAMAKVRAENAMPPRKDQDFQIGVESPEDKERAAMLDKLQVEKRKEIAVRLGMAKEETAIDKEIADKRLEIEKFETDEAERLRKEAQARFETMHVDEGRKSQVASDEKLKAQSEAADKAVAAQKGLYDRLKALDAGEFDESRKEREVRLGKELDEQYKHELISLTEFLEKKHELESGSLQRSRDEVAEEENVLEFAVIDLQGKIARLNDALEQDPGSKEIQGQIDALNVDLQLQLNKLIDAKNELLKVDAKLDDLEQKHADRVREEADKYVKKAGTDLGKYGDTTQKLYERGVITEAEAQARRAAATADFKEKLAEVNALLEKAYNEESDPQRREALAQSMEENAIAAEDALAKVKYSSEYFAAGIRDGLQSPMSTFFKSIMDGTSNVQQAFGKMLQSIAGKMMDFVASEVANKFINMLGGGGKDGSGGIIGSIGGFLGGLFGGGGSDGSGGGLFTNTFGAAEGGVVPGGDYGPDVDRVSAVLVPHEFVMRRAAHRYYGTGLFNAINNMSVPRSVVAALGSGGRRGFALGGAVGHTAGGQTVIHVPHVVSAVVAPSEEHAASLLQSPGGLNTIFKIMGDHRTKINGLLGNV